MFIRAHLTPESFSWLQTLLSESLPLHENPQSMSPTGLPPIHVLTISFVRKFSFRLRKFMQPLTAEVPATTMLFDA